MARLLSRVYAALASLKLTIVVLGSVAVILIYGTFYESANGTPMAQASVYHSLWFDAILTLLFVNMVACTAKRYPYKPHQLGFLMVHCGILTILTGAMLTRHFGREGELFLNEGEARDFFTSARPYLRVTVPKDGIEGFEVPVVFPAKEIGADVDRTVRLPEGPVRLRFSKYFPNSRPRSTVVEGTKDNPAVLVRWTHGQRSDETWLLPRDPNRQAVDDPLRIETFESAHAAQTDSLLLALASERSQGRGELRLRFPDRRVADIPLEDGSVPGHVEEGPYRVHLLEWFSHFVLRNGKPVNATSAMTNPALLFDVEGPKGTENHIVFAFHEMASLLPGAGDLGYGIDADYLLEGGGGANAPRVVLVRDPQNNWRIGANFDLDAVDGAPVEIGRTYTSPGARLELTVSHLLDRAEAREEVVNVDRQERNPALLMRIENGSDHTEPTWLVYGDQRTLRAGDRDVHIEFGRRQFPLGFSVQLVDFVETTYPGTNRSATFASDVLVESGPQQPVPIHISMNKPLKHRGFRLFQSSFVRQGAQEASIFSVSFDPGVTVVYTGFIIFISGMVAIFYLKPIIKKAYLRSAVGERT